MCAMSGPSLPLKMGAVGASITTGSGGNNWIDQLAKYRSPIVYFGASSFELPPSANAGSVKYANVFYHGASSAVFPDPFGDSNEVKALASAIANKQVSV